MTLVSYPDLEKEKCLPKKGVFDFDEQLQVEALLCERIKNLSF